MVNRIHGKTHHTHVLGTLRTLCDFDHVHRLIIWKTLRMRQRVGRAFGMDILMERSSERHVERLHTAAYPQHRLICGNRSLDEHILHQVARSCRAMCHRLASLTITTGLDVLPARNKEAVACVHKPLNCYRVMRCGQNNGDSSCLEQARKVFVVNRQTRPFEVIARYNADNRSLRYITQVHPEFLHVPQPDIRQRRTVFHHRRKRLKIGTLVLLETTRREHHKFVGPERNGATIDFSAVIPFYQGGLSVGDVFLPYVCQ